jgi:hypothetical protein
MRTLLSSEYLQKKDIEARIVQGYLANHLTRFKAIKAAQRTQLLVNEHKSTRFKAC